MPRCPDTADHTHSATDTYPHRAHWPHNASCDMVSDIILCTFLTLALVIPSYISFLPRTWSFSHSVPWWMLKMLLKLIHTSNSLEEHFKNNLLGLNIKHTPDVTKIIRTWFQTLQFSALIIGTECNSTNPST